MYAVLCVALGNQDTLAQPVPFWNPLDWNVGYLLETLRNFWHGEQFLTVFIRTFAYVAIALALSLAIGYPVAYYAARHAGRWRGLVLLAAGPAVLDQLPDADAGVDQPALAGRLGHAVPARLRHRGAVRAARAAVAADGGWLDGQSSSVVIALVYGYIPFFILPLFAALDRIDQRHIEAARDLGASPFAAFLRVTLPLSMPGILAGAVLIALPMFGDYYTPT